MRRLIIVLLACLPTLAGADPAILGSANRLLQAQQPVQALEVLLPLRESEADNAEYHYLLGIAQLDSGKLDEAIASLRRSLELNPDLLQARAELGRAYVLNGEPIKAYLAFKTVREANPPPEVLAGMDRFTTEMARSLAPKDEVFGALFLSAGYDTNVNSGTTATGVALPIFGGIIGNLPPSANPQRDSFYSLGGYVSLRHALGEQFELIGNVAANGRYNFDRDLSTYDIENVGANGGVEYTTGSHQFRVLGFYDQINYGGPRLRNEAGVALDWRLLLDLPLELDFNYRHTQLDYPSDSLRDARRDVYGVALLPAFFNHRIQYAPPLANVYFGEERPSNSGVDQLGYRLWGVRAAWVGNVLPSTSLFVSGGYEERNYGGTDPTFLETRVDRQTDLSAGLIYDVARNFSLLPSVQWIDNNSNLEVYANRRTLYTLTLRMTF